MSEFGPEDLGSDIDPETGNFIKKTPEINQQPTNPEIESSIDFTPVEHLMNDGSVDEYREHAGAVPVEGALLEPLGHEETWPQLSKINKGSARAMLSNYASTRGLHIFEDERSLMAA